ncbi:hypothetical protein B0J12DRAFT_153913 [Macrophomina phaseolina]|uniref:Uncharacterized protein n=1 Tax=Macrophomina phaseolina TaxID=35725 RepID=A0ABQ8G5A9_9PEZI|nr:hypothetical protein B0J12DRAFT_153913 [Macrophomina phaseolina]
MPTISSFVSRVCCRVIQSNPDDVGACSSLVVWATDELRAPVSLDNRYTYRASPCLVLARPLGKLPKVCHRPAAWPGRKHAGRSAFCRCRQRRPSLHAPTRGTASVELHRSTLHCGRQETQGTSYGTRRQRVLSHDACHKACPCASTSRFTVLSVFKRLPLATLATSEPGSPTASRAATVKAASRAVSTALCASSGFASPNASEDVRGWVDECKANGIGKAELDLDANHTIVAVSRKAYPPWNTVRHTGRSC